MSYHIYHSNSLTEFINRYSGVFHSDSLFGEKVITVVQNANIASWLKLKLAEKEGISMDLEMLLPEKAVRHFIQGYEAAQELFHYDEGRERTVLFMDSLKIVLYKKLEELLNEPCDPVYRDLFSYVWVDNGIDEGEGFRGRISTTRLFQLADSIAGLFFHYGMNCPAMADAWDRGELYAREGEEPKKTEHQRWQMSLWRELFHGSTPYLHLSKVLTAIQESGQSWSGEKCRIILFGSSFLGESAIKFFNYLSKDVDIHHFILTPSEIYSEPEEQEPRSLLKSFSGLINGFASLSREFDNSTRYRAFIDEKEDNLLSILKKGLLENSLEETPRSDPLVYTSGDTSFSVSGVSGKWRETEVLKDEILSLLKDNPDIKLTDIGVLAPEINDYADYIEAVFPDVSTDEEGGKQYGRSHLPYNIMGLKGGEDSPYIRGFLSLLELPGAQFTRKEILSLLDNPCFAARFHITPLEREFFRNLIVELNIKWGVNRTHRNSLGQGHEDFNTWEKAWERLLLGMALKEGEEIPYSLNDSSALESAGKLIHIVRTLYADLFFLHKEKLNIEDWVYLIEFVMEHYLAPVKGDTADESDRLNVKGQFRNLLNLVDDLKSLENFDDPSVPYSVFKSLLKEFVVKASGTRGRYLTQGITCSSLKPLRAVPFKVIYVLGLNEDSFPGKESLLSYDLRGLCEQKIDLSRRQNDKFAFLEVLLSAEKKVGLFYTCKNNITGEPLQPSVVINELYEAVRCNFDLKQDPQKVFCRFHPLHSFDFKYYTPGSGYSSFDERGYKSARVYAESVKKELSGLSLSGREREPGSDGIIDVSVRELASFMKNPVKSYFNQSEGIYLDETTPVEEDIYENMDLDFIHKWVFVRDAVNRALNEGTDLRDSGLSFFHEASVRGDFKNSVLTGNEREGLLELLDVMDEYLVENNLKKTDYSRICRSLDRYPDSDHVFPPLIVDLGDKKVRISGDLDDLWIKEKHCFITGITFSGDKGLRLKDKLVPYLYSLITFSHPHMEEEVLTMYMAGKNKPEPMDFLSREMDSRDKLASLVRLYLKNSQKPIPLFPDIMEGETLPEVYDAWRKKGSDGSWSPVSRCPYVQKAYREMPEIEQGDFDDFVEAVYGVLR